MNNKYIKLECNGCFRIVIRPEYENYLGMKHGYGWRYKCEECNATMKVIRTERIDHEKCLLSNSV